MAVKNGLDTLKGLFQCRDGLFLIDARLVLIRWAVIPQRVLEVLQDADVVDNQSTWLVLEHTIDAGNRLHQAMSAHRLVDIHRVHARRIEARKPHVPDDHKLERVGRVSGSLRERIASSFVADMLLPRRGIGGSTCHHDFDGALVVIIRVPFGTQRNDLVVQINADAAAHADGHCLTVERLQPRFEMLNQIGRNLLEALLGSDKRLDRRPFRFEFLCLGEGLILDELFDLGVDLRLLVLVEFDAGQPAFVVDRHRRAIFHRARDVVHVDIVAEDRRCIAVLPFNGRAGEADERGVRHRLTNVVRVAVAANAVFASSLASSPYWVRALRRR